MRWLTLLLAFTALSACTKGPEADWVRGETGTVARILDGDTLALNTGQIVRLVSVEAPGFAYKGRPEHPYAETSKRELETLALGKQITLYYPGLTRDSYDRALAHAFVEAETSGRIWLNKELVERGSVWVRVYSDTRAGSDELWQAETRVRQSRAGVWSGGAPLYYQKERLPDYGFVIVTSGPLAFERANDACRAKLDELGLDVEVAMPADEPCPPASDTDIELRGWLSNNRLRLDDTQNVRPVSD